MYYHFVRIMILGVAFLFMAGCSSSLADNQKIDLGISSLITAPSTAPGGPLFTTVTIDNMGDLISMTETVTFYLSLDESINSLDYEIGSLDVSFIRPGTSVTENRLLEVPSSVPPGTYYAGAVLSGKFDLQPDTNQENNIICTGPIDVARTYERPADWYYQTISDLIVSYSNDERVLRNLPEFVRDDELDVIARENSEDMAVRDYFEHVNPDGEDPVDRAKRHGYDQLKTLSDGRQFYGIGENIVKIPVGSSIYEFGKIDPDDPDRIAQVAVESFMNSPPHKENLLLPEHLRIGVGVSFDGHYYYATQNFF